MPFNKTAALNGHAKPFIPTSHRQQHPQYNREPFFDARIKRLGTPRPSEQTKLSLEAIKKAISSNNAFMLGQKLLELEKDAENLELWQDTVGTVWNALRGHHDPAMFLLNVLITIGTISGYKSINPSFEFAISGDMVEILRRLLEENNLGHNQDQDKEKTLSSTPVSMHSPFLTYSSQEQPRTGTPGFFVDEDFVNPSSTTRMKVTKVEELSDLIVLDEFDLISSNDSPQSILLPIKPQSTGSSSLFGNLLDDNDVNESPNLLHLAVLKPATMDLIDFSGPDDSDGFSPLKTSLTGATISTGKKLASPPVDLLDMLFDGCGNEEKLESIDAQADIPQSSTGESEVSEEPEQQTENEWIEQDEEEESEEKNPLSEELREIFYTEPSTIVNDEGLKEFPEHQGHEATDIIGQRHRDKILKELMTGKCCLQIFLLIDVLEIQENLADPIKDSDFATGNIGSSCGWLLAHQLHDHGWFQESSTLIFEYLEPSFQSLTPKLISSVSLATASPIRPVAKMNGLSHPRAPQSLLPLPSGSRRSPAPPPSNVMSRQNLPIYRLPSLVKTVIVDSNDSLELLSISLQSSSIVGMDTEWLPFIKKYQKIRSTSGTAILQLSCNSDSTVYIVDTIAFLHQTRESEASEEKFIQVIGGLFNNPKILKIAYDWDGDMDLLETTYPELAVENYRLRNFMDLNSEESENEVNSPKSSESPITTLPSPPLSVGPKSSPTLSALSLSPTLPPVTTLASGTNPKRTASPNLSKLRIIPGGLSGMLSYICKYKLDKTQQCSNWEQRPLIPEQLVYAAVDAWCLQEIYSAIHTIERIRP
ncbi:Exonuclease mut-7 [Entomortierella beljakovae]|nr:Exonuclease mut-7 [Entomortierella beljakovae]